MCVRARVRLRTLLPTTRTRPAEQRHGATNNVNGADDSDGNGNDNNDDDGDDDGGDGSAPTYLPGEQQLDGGDVIRASRAVQEAGAFAVVLEGIPAKLAARITELLDIPTIGCAKSRLRNGRSLLAVAFSLQGFDAGS